MRCFLLSKEESIELSHLTFLGGSSMNKGNPWVLIPFVIFLILFISSGIITGDFYSIPVIVAIVISGAVAWR